MRNKNFRFEKEKTSMGGAKYIHSFIVTVRGNEITKVYESADRGEGYIFSAPEQKDLLGCSAQIINSQFVLLMQTFGHDTTDLENALV